MRPALLTANVISLSCAFSFLYCLGGGIVTAIFVLEKRTVALVQAVYCRYAILFSGVITTQMHTMHTDNTVNVRLYRYSI